METLIRYIEAILICSHEIRASKKKSITRLKAWALFDVVRRRANKTTYIEYRNEHILDNVK